jgi:hypothetical protein
MTSAMPGQTDTDIFFCDLSPANRGPEHFFPTLLAVDFRGATWREPSFKPKRGERCLFKKT